MKKQIITIIVALLCILTLCGCKTEEAKMVDDTIAWLGEITLKSKDKIEEAENAVAALSEEDQKSLDNLEILENARKKYDDLVELAKNKEHYDVKGFFVMEKLPEYFQDDGIEWYEKKPNEHEALAYIVLDLIPDAVKNSAIESTDVSLTFNGANKYPLEKKEKPIITGKAKNLCQQFLITSGYKRINRDIPAGGEKERVLLGFIINKAEIRENMTATLEIAAPDLYKAKIDFCENEITKIERFDEVFQVESNPSKRTNGCSLYNTINFAKLICSNNVYTENFMESFVALINLTSVRWTPDGHLVDTKEYDSISIEEAAELYPQLPIKDFFEAKDKAFDDLFKWIKVKNTGFNDSNFKDFEKQLDKMKKYANEIIDFYLGL